VPTILGYTPANDSNVVHLTGNETISGEKTLNNSLLIFKNLDNAGTSRISVSTSGFFLNIDAVGGDNDYVLGKGSLSMAKQKSPLIASTISNSLLTTSRLYQLPNAAGTFALTSDLHNPITIETANGLSLSTQVLSLGLSSSTTTGALSSSDWINFTDSYNNKISSASVVRGTVPIAGNIYNTMTLTQQDGGTLTASFPAGYNGTGNTYYVPKFSLTVGELVDSLIYDSGSGVGIGTTNLNAPSTGGTIPILAVGGLSGSVLQLRNTTSTTLAGSTLGLIQFTSSYSGSPFATANIRATSVNTTSGGASGGANIIFDTSTGLTGENPTERMRLLNNGYLGIGITNPFTALDVSKADASGNNAYFGNGTSGLMLQTNSTSYDIIGYNKTALNNIRIRATAGATNQLVLNTAGNVGIKTATISYTLHVNGSVAGTSAYVNLSDRRHKKDILPIENALDKVLSLNGVTFNWDKSNTDMNLDDRNHIGLLAQDVELIIPQAVVTADDENKTKSVAYTDLIPVLIEAIKELKAEIELLKNK
jgi:hypothetical protein